MMKKLKLGKVLGLHKEVQKLASEKLPFITKYKLNKLLNILSSEVADFNKTRDEAIKRFGDVKMDDEGKATSEMYIDQNSPNWQEFLNEIGIVLEEDIKFSCKPLNLQEFENIESTEPYSVIFELISE